MIDPLFSRRGAPTPEVGVLTYYFTGVCLPTGGSQSLSGGLVQGGLRPERVSVWGGLCPGDSLSKGSLSKGLSVRGGNSVQGGLCPGGSLLGRNPLDKDPPYGNKQRYAFLFSKKIAENCMKLKEFGPRSSLLEPPMKCTFQ